MYRPNMQYYSEFIVYNPSTGEVVNADSTPVATASNCGVDDSDFALTVTNINTGRYLINGIIPSDYLPGNIVTVFIITTVSSIVGKAIVDSFMIDNSNLVVFPPTQVSVFSNVAYQSVTKELARGDTPTFTFDFAYDYSGGWVPYFAIKRDAEDSGYLLTPKTCSWTDDTKGQGSVTLTATDTNIIGECVGEIELRNGSSRLTVIRYNLTFIQDIIT